MIWPMITNKKSQDVLELRINVIQY